jgi:condensin complex subunit 1
MLKLRGEIVDICMLLEDSDERIRDQVKLFLHELHSKGNHIIYNLFPKAITRLSKEFESLSKDEFENIAKHLIAYIKQDKQVETLVEKLCHKLKNSVLQVEWRNTAFCLSQLRMTDKLLQRLLECYDMYKERLVQSPEVKEYFLVVVSNCKKIMRPELK